MGKDNLTRIEYCDLAKSVSFWERIDTDKILFMQTDGCLCKKSQYKVEDFYKYDYVGGYAPQAWWSKELRIAKINKNEFPYQCLNGGFSLRTTEACKKVIETFTPRQSIEYTNYNKQTRMENLFEDLFFACGMHLLGYNVGRDKFATNFCTHTEYVSNTFCVHNLFKYKRVNSFWSIAQTMIIYVDIDNTICKTPETGEYHKAKPMYDHIAKINAMYDSGHTIIYWQQEYKNWKGLEKPDRATTC